MYQDLSHRVDRKRILIVLAGSFQPSGGMFEYAKAWINLLLSNGWEVGFCGVPAVACAMDEACCKYDLPVELDSGSKYYKTLALTSLLNTGAAKRLLKALVNVIDNFKPSVCHIVDRPVFIGYILKRLSACRTDILFLTTLHDPIRHDEKISDIGRILLKYDDRRFIRACEDRNVSLHVHSRSLLHGSKFEGIKNVIEMPHPLPRTIVTRKRREPHNGDIYPIRLGFFGRIEPYKGLDILYDALLSGIQIGFFDNRRIELVIAGRGEIKQPWSDLPLKVEIYNSVLSDTDFHQMIADIDLLVLPYKNGTQSGVGMLGAAYGIPLIATNVGALHNLIIEGVNGHLIEPNRSDCLRDTIKRLVNDPEELAGLRLKSKQRL